MAVSALSASVPLAPAASPEYQLFWGDLHNHNSIGYAKGSLERTYDIARTHLDFLAFTPHAQWHDMPSMPKSATDLYLNGFKKTQESWPEVRRIALANNQPGKFVSLLAYEWHSSYFGDHCVYYPTDEGTLSYFNHVRDLQKHARASQAILIPHHLAYKQGFRGANFNYFDPSVSPVLEIYSEHGMAEQDRGGRDYLTHTWGGRSTPNTLRAFLSKGLRAGVIASTDDHLGFPGANGEGIAGVYAKDLSRAGVLESLRNRRTIQSSGDRIGLIFKLNRQWMGSSLPFAADRELEVSVDAQDEIERVEIVKNDRVVYRYFPADFVKDPKQWPGHGLCRLEFGWGLWSAYGIPGIYDWEFQATLQNGRLLAVQPCLQSGPFDENRRHRIWDRTGNSFRMRSYTSRTDAYEDRATNVVVLHAAGSPDAVLVWDFMQPVRMTIRKTLGELLLASEVGFTDPGSPESVLMHRIVVPQMFQVSFRWPDHGKSGQADWYYARVYQTNRQQAWSSPIWVEGA